MDEQKSFDFLVILRGTLLGVIAVLTAQLLGFNELEGAAWLFSLLGLGVAAGGVLALAEALIAVLRNAWGVSDEIDS